MNKKTLQIIAMVLALAFVGYYLTTTPKPSGQPDANQNGDQDQENPTAKATYTSDSLGVAFEYLPDQSEDGVIDAAVSERDDKIYVHYTDMPPESGQWVQKFDKDPSDNLVVAIQKKFLQNYSSADCYAQSLEDFYKSLDITGSELPPNAELALIAYPIPTDPNLPFWENSNKCPETYSLANGISYFYMDKVHTDKFYFFSIGQYAIFADRVTQTPWQDTFRVNK